MRRINTATHLALLPLSGLIPIAAAPDEPKSEGELHSTRVFVEKDEEHSTRVVEKQLTIRLEASPKTAYCEATLAVEYLQRDTIASVEGTIENGDCAASNGDYAIAVRIRDQNGELKALEFDESWHRGNDQPVKFRADYPIGENVDLVSVRGRRLRCVCADTPGE